MQRLRWDERVCVCVCVCVCVRVSVRACACVCLNNNAGSCFVTLFLVHSYIRPARDNHHVIKCASSLTLSPCVAGQRLPVTCGEADIERQFGLFVAGLNTYLTSNHTIANHTFNLNYTLPPLRVEVSIEVCVCVCVRVCACVCVGVYVCAPGKGKREKAARVRVWGVASFFLPHPSSLTTQPHCAFSTPWSVGTICTVALCAVLAVLLVVASVVDLLTRPVEDQVCVCVCVCVWL